MYKIWQNKHFYKNTRGNMNKVKEQVWTKHEQSKLPASKIICGKGTTLILPFAFCFVAVKVRYGVGDNTISILIMTPSHVPQCVEMFNGTEEFFFLLLSINISAYLRLGF